MVSQGWRSAATAVALVAPPIWLTDTVLSRHQRELISGHWWKAIEHPGPYAALIGAWTATTFHLFNPTGVGDRWFDSWRTPLVVGAATGVAVRVLNR